LPEGMRRSMSRQAEAERERRARIIVADAELQASSKLSQAASAMAATPGALQLRMLQTVVDVAAEKNSTLVMPFPVELLRFFDRATSGDAQRLADPGTERVVDTGTARAEVTATDRAGFTATERGEVTATERARSTAPTGSARLPQIPRQILGERGELRPGFSRHRRRPLARRTPPASSRP